MKHLLKSITGIALCITIFSACSKNDQPAPDSSSVSSTKEFIEQLGPQIQQFNMNSNELPKTITLESGMKITIPSGTFRKDGAEYNGAFSVEVMEFMDRASMVAGGLNTLEINGNLLESQGSFYFNATAGGVNLDPNLAKGIEVELPAKGADFTVIWAGKDTAQQFAWGQPNNRLNLPIEMKAEDDKFIFSFGDLGWVNCDIFYQYANPKTTVTVEVQNNPGTMATFRAAAGETYVYFIAKNANVVAQLYTSAGTNTVKSYDNSMPIGEEGTLMSFSIKDGNFYLAKKEITISADQSEILVLQPSTQEAIQAAIDALN
ncbi:hypothetical protein COR50_13685 [Chitinophaga caeni]|uniref:Uncharacterized protein n=1 Tax=Chitinophaga caeni TaxID=2029983 RepID=A0A291QVX8_9BACT|nr:hypothetical protein [Chitinophaga caeni]ATL48128.1 hypothetical protein COR50_13685 [Chitinophaga caeni]